MEELKDKSLHLTAEKLAEELQKMDIYNEFYEDLQVGNICLQYITINYIYTSPKSQINYHFDILTF